MSLIPLFKVFVATCAMDHVNQVLMSGYIGEGNQVQRFEERFGEYVHNPNVVAVQSGTAALTIALRLAGVGHGDWVVTTPMTCLATNMPILSVGANPIWADILPDGTIDPVDVERKMQADTKAIICMDWGGLPCKLNELKDIADHWGVPLIHDACQSVGGGYNGKPSIGGSPAQYVAVSFQAIKHLTTGDGGALICNDPAKLERARLMKWFGLDRTKTESLRCGQDPPEWGYKFQMNDIAAAIGLSNLRTICYIVRKTRANAQYYNRHLQGLEHFKVIPFDRERGRSGHWLYTCFVEDVPHFVKYMADNDVMCNKVHDRNDIKTVFNASKREDLPGVDYFDAHHVCIPVGYWVDAPDRERIAGLCQNYLS